MSSKACATEDTIAGGTVAPAAPLLPTPRYPASHVALYDNALSPRLRRKLLRLRDQMSPVRRAVGVSGFDEWLVPDGELASAIRAGQGEIVHRYRSDLGLSASQWPGRAGGEVLRLKQFAPGDWFPPHVDVVDHGTARRFLAFLWYVQSPDRGGETVFLPNGPTIEPREGACLVFPPLWTHPHEGRPAHGVKVILSSYLHYPEDSSHG